MSTEVDKFEAASTPHKTAQSLDILPLDISIPTLECDATTDAFFNAYKSNTPLMGDECSNSDQRRLTSSFRGRTLVAKPIIPGNDLVCMVTKTQVTETAGTLLQLVSTSDSLIEWSFPEDAENMGSLTKSVEWFDIASSIHSNS